MGIEFSKRAVIRVIMDAMAGLDSLKDIYDKVEAMDEPTQPEPVEVPDVEQYIADWYEEHRNDTLEAKFSRAKTDKDIRVQNWYNNCEGRHVNKRANAQEIIAKMTLYGYTVKKEQLYYVVLKNTTQTNANHCYLWLNQATKKVFFDLKNKKWTNYGNIKNTFTEQEIVAISDGAFADNKAFEAVPVEEEAE